MLSKRKVQAPPDTEKGNATPVGSRDGAKKRRERAALSDQKYDGAAVSSTGSKAPRREKATLQQKIARKYAGETPAQRAYHLEIARRYAWSDDDRANVHKIPKLRLRQLESLFAKRYGPTLPDDDCGRDCLVVVADHIAQFGNPLKHIPAWAALWAPWLTSDELAILIDNAISRRKHWRAGPLGRELRLTEEERTMLRITTFRPYNVTKAGLAKSAKQRKRKSDTARRRNAGGVARAEYEARSAARNKPWEALGISRATWHRRGKPMPSDAAAPQSVRYQVRETSPRGAEERYWGEATRLTAGDEQRLLQSASLEDAASPSPSCTSPRRAEEGHCKVHTSATGDPDRTSHGGTFEPQSSPHLPQPPEGKDQVARLTLWSASLDAPSPPSPLLQPETRLARAPATGSSCSFRARGLS